MSAATALRPLWLAGITDCKGARKVTTESFLRTKIVHVNSQPTSGKFTLYVGNPTKIPEYFSHEADRFSSAAFESLIVETPRREYPRSIGWLLIRSYYSAFFALHSIMRLHGWLLIDAGDRTALSSAMIRLAKNVNLRQQMGMAAREQVEKKFSKQVVLPKIEALYRSLILRD